MPTNRLAAFTVIELLTVLFLSSIIFGAIMLVFQITQQQQQQQTKDYEEITTLHQAKTLLHQDAYNAASLFRTEQTLECVYPTYRIQYQFAPKRLFRTIHHTTTHTDTFSLPTIKLESEWQGQKIVLGQIDFLSWETNFFKQLFVIKVQKKYAAQFLLQ
jgi:predicted metalloprotease